MEVGVFFLLTYLFSSETMGGRGAGGGEWKRDLQKLKLYAECTRDTVGLIFLFSGSVGLCSFGEITSFFFNRNCTNNSKQNKISIKRYDGERGPERDPLVQ